MEWLWMATLPQWSLLAQDLLPPSGAVLMTRLSLHVSLCKLNRCNGTVAGWYWCHTDQLSGWYWYHSGSGQLYWIQCAVAAIPERKIYNISLVCCLWLCYSCCAIVTIQTATNSIFSGTALYYGCTYIVSGKLSASSPKWEVGALSSLLSTFKFNMFKFGKV